MSLVLRGHLLARLQSVEVVLARRHVVVGRLEALDERLGVGFARERWTAGRLEGGRRALVVLILGSGLCLRLLDRSGVTVAAKHAADASTHCVSYGRADSDTCSSAGHLGKETRLFGGRLANGRRSRLA